MSASALKPGILLGCGNPLLDISAEVDKSVFEKYGLEPGNAILAEDKHKPLFDEMLAAEGHVLLAGGATQNSIRAAQWMLGPDAPAGVAAFIGGVGKDGNKAKLQAAADKARMTTHYYEHDTAPTGRCVACIDKMERSLVADLAAANEYSKEKHWDTPEVQEVVNAAQFIYSSGFFVTASGETLMAEGEHCAAHPDKKFLLNLAAPFLMQVPPFWAALQKAIECADVVFCNETEAATLGEVTGWGDKGKDLMAVAKALQGSPKRGEGERVVVFTQGADATIVCTAQGDADTVKYAVPPVPKEKIVDTNGAGDSFVGGFLSRYIQGKDLETCVKAGHYCASECIQLSGASYPEKPNYTD